MIAASIEVMKRAFPGPEQVHQAHVRKELEEAVKRVAGVAQWVLDNQLMLLTILGRKPAVDFEIVRVDSQRPGSFGFINFGLASKICDLLNGLNSPDIHFYKGYIRSYLDDGACSAMTMNFLFSYFSLQNQCISQKNFTESIINGIRVWPKRYSDEETRSLQGAFNTITLGCTSEDPSRLKVQALLSYYNFKIIEANKERDWFDGRPLVEVIQEIKSLVDGVYFVRNILPMNNYKMEYNGHSTAFIKKGRMHLYYDPNIGVIKIKPKQSPIFLLEHLWKDYQLFRISRFRFYRIQPEG